jgi:uncharacterized membrane protein YtjA (UPF0391 family)
MARKVMKEGLQVICRPYKAFTRQLIRDSTSQEIVMLYWALVFLVVALVAGVLGFTGIAGTSAGIAQILFWIFLVVFVGSLLLGKRVRKVA